VFYCNKDFLDVLIAVDDVSISARNLYGRIPLFHAFDVSISARDLYCRMPLFHAFQRATTTRARYLIEKGADLHDF
jgi:hypothetical protein